MATKVLSNEFMQNMTIEEAWKELSKEYYWSEALLEKYQNKVNWDSISENRNICWTIPMIQKFQKKINWDLFSKNVTKETLTIAILETFKDKWNWSELSENYCITLTEDMLEKFADKWHWNRIIRRYYDSFYDCRGIDFYEKYKEYIPTNDIQYTNLWRGIIDQQIKQLKDEIKA